MTRTLPGLFVLTMLGAAVAGLAEIDAAQAQFGIFYGPPTTRHVHRPRRRPQPAPPVPPPTPAPPAATGEVPLPPPRPRFPDDPPVPAEVAPAGPTPAVPEAGPPEKPAELAKPHMPARPEPPLPARPEPETAKPERPKSDPPQSTSKPPVVIQPVPDELPPKGPGTRAPSKPVAPSPKDAPAPGQAPTQPLAEPAKPPAASPPSSPPLPPAKPPELTKPGAPGVAPSGARLGETPRQPEDDATCPDRLKTHNVIAESTVIGPQPDERCTVVRPVRLLSLSLPDGGKVEFPEHPTIACTTADTFSTYVRDLLAPLAKGSFGSTVAAVWTGPGLECRSRDHIFGAKLSAHGQGLAIDIAQLKLADGRKIEVGDPKDDTGQAFESAARAAACGYFHTVLGPGSDSYHRTHWHFDLIVRGAQGDSKYCK